MLSMAPRLVRAAYVRCKGLNERFSENFLKKSRRYILEDLCGIPEGYESVFPANVIRKRDISMDLVLVSDAKNAALESITRNAIKTAGPYVNIIVIESNKDVTYNPIRTIHPDIPFNYNAYLNIGAKAGSSKYIFFGNNDLIFRKNWEINLVAAFEVNNVKSASPAPLSAVFEAKDRPNLKFGYEVGTTFLGWAFVWTRQLYEQLGGLDERFYFWCSDNTTVEQLLEHNVKHMLVLNSNVDHLGSSTLRLLNDQQQVEYTHDEVVRFKNIYGKNPFSQFEQQI